MLLMFPQTTLNLQTLIANVGNIKSLSNLQPKEHAAGAHHRKTQFPDYFCKVLIPLLDLGLPCSKVAADEAQAGRVEQHADGHRALVSSRASHACLHSVDCHIPLTQTSEISVGSCVRVRH